MSPVERNSPEDARPGDVPLNAPVDDVEKGLSDPLRTEAALPPAVTVGNKPARKKPTMARAWRKCASATFTFWLPWVTCSSRALSCGSPKISHHLPRGKSSRGRASFHPWSSL